MSLSSGKNLSLRNPRVTLLSSLALALFFLLIPFHATAQQSAAEKKPFQNRFAEEEYFLDWIIEHSRLNGTAEFNFDWTDVEDTGDEDSGSARDFYIGTLELDYRLIFSQYARTKIVVNLEDLGSDTSDEKFNLDEAILDFKFVPTGIYLIGGKTTFPFGIFEDRLIGGTVTEDLYEILTIGAILGYTSDFYGLDFSLSVYRGQQVIENLSNSGTHEFRDDRNKNRNFQAFVANLSLEPIEEQLNISVFYNNEPGDGRRNQSIGSAFTINYWKFSLDAEYISAISREKDEDGEENLESAGLVGLAFRPWEQFELAARYEFFDDDRNGQQDEILNHRYICGFNLYPFEYTTLSFEYRHNDYEKETGSESASNQKEVFVQLAFEF